MNSSGSGLQVAQGYDKGFADYMTSGANLTDIANILDIKKEGKFKKQAAVGFASQGQSSYSPGMLVPEPIQGILSSQESVNVDKRLADILPLYQQRVDDYISRKKAPGITSQTKGILG